MTVAKMTVAQLREELKSRGLDTSGLKAALVSRLEASLADDGAGAEPEGEDASGARGETVARRHRVSRPRGRPRPIPPVFARDARRRAPRPSPRDARPTRLTFGTADRDD